MVWDMRLVRQMHIVFFINDTQTTEINTYGHPIALHDARPISPHARTEGGACRHARAIDRHRRRKRRNARDPGTEAAPPPGRRSTESSVPRPFPGPWH